MVPDGYSVREQLRQTPDGSQQRNPDLDPPDNFLDEVEAVGYEDDEDEYENEDYNEDDDLCYREFLTVRELMVALTHRKGLKTKSIIFKSQYNQVLAVHHEGLIRLDILESNVISWRYKPKKKRIVIKIDHQEVFRG